MPVIYQQFRLSVMQVKTERIVINSGYKTIVYRVHDFSMKCIFQLIFFFYQELTGLPWGKSNKP